MPQSQVNDVHIVMQAVKNTKTTLELLREALSNSMDANAVRIGIEFRHNSGDEWDIIIDDNGYGMMTDHIKAFFSTGMSNKNYTRTPSNLASIGEKGLGSKTTFKAKKVRIESIFHLTGDLIVAEMDDPLGQLVSGNLPSWTETTYPSGSAPPKGVTKSTQGTRIFLERVLIRSFLGSNGRFGGGGGFDLSKIHTKISHYIHTACSTGTVKSLHAGKTHINTSVAYAGLNPTVSLTVSEGAQTPVTNTNAGAYQIPSANPTPRNGTAHTQFPHIFEHSKKFCAHHSGGEQSTINGQTVHYDFTAFIGGVDVQEELIGPEKRSGVGAKSLMGLHFCKDFIPLSVDISNSKDLLHSEYYYQFKVFLNSQSFELNADRSMITNLESDEVSWILEDFKTNVSPTLRSLHEGLQQLQKNEDNQIQAAKRVRDATDRLNEYNTLTDLNVNRSGVSLNYVKQPTKEADVTHLVATMFQDGTYSTDFNPLSRFGKFVDGATDAIFEDSSGDPLLVEVEYSLRSLFSHGHPIDSFHGIIVWTLGGLTRNYTLQLPWGTGGTNVPVVLDKDASGNWIITWNTETRRVWVIEEFI